MSPFARLPRALVPARTVIRTGGFSLPELVAVMVVISIVAAVSFAAWSPATTTVSYQADLLGRNVRHAQTLAMTWNRPLRMTIAGGGYSVACITAGAAPCAGTYVTDPATNQDFNIALQNGVAVSGGATIDFDTLGRPKNGATFNSAPVAVTLNGGGNTSTVTIAPLTGFVTVSH